MIDRRTGFQIARRYRGPPESGNGGYVAGMLASLLAPDSVEVQLLKPPPLDQTLTPRFAIAGLPAAAIDLLDQAGEKVATARSVAVLSLVIPSPPSLACAQASSGRADLGERRIFPDCFVCGPARAVGDGLRIFAGPRDDLRDPDRAVAAPWRPDATLADETNPAVVALEFVWAALDCPGYFAVQTTQQTMLLAQMTVTIIEPPRCGSDYVISGWPVRAAGRKHEAGTALHSSDGRLLACARQLWIEPRS